MMFSKACEYGIKAMVYIANQSLNGNRVKIGEVAVHSGSPEAFTAKVLSILTKKGLVNANTGPNGGFAIDPSRVSEIKISEIVSAIDGDSIYNGCGLGLDKCNNLKPCPMHDKFAVVRNELKMMLQSTTLLDLALGLKDGKTMLVR